MNFDPEFGSVGERRRLKQFLQQRGAQFEPEIIDRKTPEYMEQWKRDYYGPEYQGDSESA